MSSAIPIETLFKITDAVKSESDVPTYLVGGAVRDLILFHELPIHDLDFTIEGDAAQVVRRVQNVLKGEAKFFDAFHTAKLTLDENHIEVDFVSCRQESYERPGSLPTVSKGSLEQDLARRDFSFNALAVPISAFADYLIDQDPQALQMQLVDYHQGTDDLLGKVVRVLHDDSFTDDPTRIFRAVRYATRLEAVLDPHTESLLRAALERHALNTLSPHRMLNEMRKILTEPTRAESIRLLGNLGVLEQLPWIDEEKRPEFQQIMERLVDLRLKPKESYYLSFITIPFFLQNEVSMEYVNALSWKKRVIMDFPDEVKRAQAGDDTASSEALIVSMAIEPTEKKRVLLSQRNILIS